MPDSLTVSSWYSALNFAKTVLPRRTIAAAEAPLQIRHNLLRNLTTSVSTLWCHRMRDPECYSRTKASQGFVTLSFRRFPVQYFSGASEDAYQIYCAFLTVFFIEYFGGTNRAQTCE